MTIAKKQVLSIVKDFPKNIEMEDLMYRLYVLEKIGSSTFLVGKNRAFVESKGSLKT